MVDVAIDWDFLLFHNRARDYFVRTSRFDAIASQVDPFGEDQNGNDLMTRLNRRCRMANNRGVSPSSFRDSANNAPISDPFLSRSLRCSVTEPLLMASKKSDCSFKDGLRRGAGPGSNNARGVTDGSCGNNLDVSAIKTVDTGDWGVQVDLQLRGTLSQRPLGKRNQTHRQTRRGGTESSVGESIMNAGKIDDDYGESITMPYIPLLFPCVEGIVIFSIGIILSR
ncbi:hypothetical protein OUZ56_005285 [Daphnia magna]|uniref:Uncharacterized protein n=1 Tax=Daphnia magna TaxID=35525 RepID=A0ABQ9YSH0_9CRUS|nr:hypothetical protein OUZ56_005285 [Daphnia magna]